MVIDTSAVVAILMMEPGAAALAAAMAGDPVRLMSPVSLVECSIVMSAKVGEAGARELDLLMFKAQIETPPLTRTQADLARYAFDTFGKGRHPAALNLGDCFPYALSRASGEPLLYKGDDFGRTDVSQAGVSGV